MKEAVEIQLPRGGAGTMEAFCQNTGSSMAGTVVEDEERTTTGASIANKSLWTIDDGMLGRLGSPGGDNDSNGSSQHGGQDMEIELPAGRLDEMNNASRDHPGGSRGEDDGSGLNPVLLDLGNISNAGGGRFVFRQWHVGMRENALGGADNKYAIIGNFDEFRQENNRDESHGSGYIAMRIKDFGGDPKGMSATTYTNYVIVGQPPRGRAEREFYDKHLKKADIFELPLIAIDKLMRQISGKGATIKGSYETKEDNDEGSASMEEDDNENTARVNTTGKRDSDNMKEDGE